MNKQAVLGSKCHGYWLTIPRAGWLAGGQAPVEYCIHCSHLSCCGGSCLLAGRQVLASWHHGKVSVRSCRGRACGSSAVPSRCSSRLALGLHPAELHSFKMKTDVTIHVINGGRLEAHPANQPTHLHACALDVAKHNAHREPFEQRNIPPQDNSIA